MFQSSIRDARSPALIFDVGLTPKICGNCTEFRSRTVFFPHRRLRIANAGMKTTGSKAIAAALCANHTLEVLDLSGNYFGCKADDSTWEIAADLLSFGLEVRMADLLGEHIIG